MDCIVFSKDRACQLDLFIRGIISQKELNQRYLGGFVIDKQFIYDLDYSKSFFVYIDELEFTK